MLEFKVFGRDICDASEGLWARRGEALVESVRQCLIMVALWFPNRTNSAF